MSFATKCNSQRWPRQLLDSSLAPCYNSGSSQAHEKIRAEMLPAISRTNPISAEFRVAGPAQTKTVIFRIDAHFALGQVRRCSKFYAFGGEGANKRPTSSTHSKTSNAGVRTSLPPPAWHGSCQKAQAILSHICRQNGSSFCPSIKHI
jgi:hypothetical protein